MVVKIKGLYSVLQYYFMPENFRFMHNLLAILIHDHVMHMLVIVNNTALLVATV